MRFCYKYYNIGLDEGTDDDVCSDYDANMVSFQSDDEVQGFLNITSTFGGIQWQSI